MWGITLVVAEVGEEQRAAGEWRDHFQKEVPHSWGSGRAASREKEGWFKMGVSSLLLKECS